MIDLFVSAFNQLFSNIVQEQLSLNQLCLRGEITQLNWYHNHLYMTLSHQQSHMACAVYNAHQKSLPPIKKGDACAVIGDCRYLKNKGQLIFSVHAILPKGTGQMADERAKIMADYKAKGAFDQKTPAHIPSQITRVCLITSPNSAAHHDIQSIIHHSFHLFQVELVPSTMQGDRAVSSLIHALEYADSRDVDLICLARGGGADSDFDCYFSTDLAQCMAQRRTPIICGIGHQINLTLCCCIANQHFETPTAMIQWLCDHSQAYFSQLIQRLDGVRTQLCHDLDRAMRQLNEYESRVHHRVQEWHHNVSLIQTKWHQMVMAMNPLNRLKNGFVYAQTEHQIPIKSVQQLKKNDTITIRLFDGSANVVIHYVNQTETHTN